MNWLAIGGIMGGVVALGQLLLVAYNSIRGREWRKTNAEAAKASLDAVQAEASLPFIQKSLELGNVAEAVAIQQGIINGLRDHTTWQDNEIGKRDARIEELEKRLTERDNRIEELENRLEAAEKHLDDARRIIGELRATRLGESGGHQS